MNDQIDLLELLAAQADMPTQAELQSVSVLVNQAMTRQRYIDKLEAALTREKAALHALLSSAIPDVMASAGTQEFVTDDGFKVTIKDFISGSLPKDEERRAEALQWIEQSGAADLIKNEINAQFGKGEDNVAGDIKQRLLDLGVSFTNDRGVHPSTLKAFAAERIRNGEDIPLEMLGLYAGRQAKIVPPRGK